MQAATAATEMADRLSPPPGAADTARGFELPFGRQQIADILGLTIETTSRQFTKMRADGLIDLPSRRKIVINDLAALNEMAG